VICPVVLVGIALSGGNDLMMVFEACITQYTRSFWSRLYWR
jgi:hypothetical protein